MWPNCAGKFWWMNRTCMGHLGKRMRRGRAHPTMAGARQATRVLHARIRPLLESAPAQTPPPAERPAVATAGGPLRRRVRELPLPAPVAAEAERYGQRLGFWRAKDRRKLEEQMKLQHYYGGKWIAYL